MSSTLSYSLVSLRRLSGVARYSLCTYSNNASRCAAVQPCHLINMVNVGGTQWCTVRCFASTPVEADTSTVGARNNETKKEIEPMEKLSLAISVWFMQPELGMEKYELLSRGTAFLLSVDGKDPVMDDRKEKLKQKTDPYGHLQRAQRIRENENSRSNNDLYSVPSGERSLTDLGWLEYVPKEVRPRVHIVCSSHVVSPFLWREYYTHDWLKKVNQQHVKYSVEVFDTSVNYCPSASSPNNPKEHYEPKPLAQIEVLCEPTHHPEGRDVALLYFREEAEALKILQQHGVGKLFLRSPDKLYEKGEAMTFDGFVVQETNVITDENDNVNESDAPNANEDNRVFYPYIEEGTLEFHDPDRFYSATPRPLPEGMCGAPVIDTDGDCCGIVEGIVPLTNPNTNIAGTAVFMPSYVLKAFIDFFEKHLVERMMPEHLFQTVTNAKLTNTLGGVAFKRDEQGNYTKEIHLNEAYDLAISKLKQKYTPDEVQAIMKMVQKERDDVLQLMDDGGEQEVDMHDAVRQVREKTILEREFLKDQYIKEGQATNETSTESKK